MEEIQREIEELKRNNAELVGLLQDAVKGAINRENEGFVKTPQSLNIQ